MRSINGNRASPVDGNNRRRRPTKRSGATGKILIRVVLHVIHERGAPQIRLMVYLQEGEAPTTAYRFLGRRSGRGKVMVLNVLREDINNDNVPLSSQHPPVRYASRAFACKVSFRKMRGLRGRSAASLAARFRVVSV